MSISNIRTSSHDSPIFAADIGLSCWVQSLPSLQAPRPCSGLKFLRTLFCRLFKKYYDKTLIEFGFYMISWIIQPRVCVICPSLRFQQMTQTRFWQFMISYDFNKCLSLLLLQLLLISLLSLLYSERNAGNLCTF